MSAQRIMKAERFTRATLAKYVFGHLDAMRGKYGFVAHRGWAQVEGKGEEKNRAYGEWDAMQMIVDRFGLEEGES